MRIEEGSVLLSFENGAKAQKYDESRFYREAFSSTAGGSGGVDVVCLAREACWLVEIKEIRRNLAEDRGLHDLKIQDTLGRAAIQVRDTLSGLATARLRAVGEDREFAREAFSAGKWRVVVHFDQRDSRTSRLRPHGAVSLASLRSKLRKIGSVGAIDPRAVAMDSTSPAEVPWTVANH